MATLTIEQFGQTIKKKYPQYADISDADLGQKMLSKYPQYKDMVSASQPEKKGLGERVLGAVGNFTGVSKLGEAIGGLLGLGGIKKAQEQMEASDKQYTDILLKRLKTSREKGDTIETDRTLEKLKNFIPQDVLSQYVNELPTAKQVVGSAIQTAATVGTIGIGAGKILPTLAKVGTAGAVSGFGEGLEKEKNIKDSLKQAFTSGLASAATFGVLIGAGKIAKQVLQKIPYKIYSSVAKLEPESARALLNAKQIGGLGKLKGYVDAEGSRLNNIIQEKINANNGKITSKDFIKSVVAKIQDSWQGVSKDKILKAIKAADIDPFLKNKSVDYLTADNIRRGLGNTIGNAWRTDNPKFNLSVRDILWKEIVNTIRPATGTTAEFAQYAPLVDASKSIGKIISNQDKKFGLSLYDVIGGGLGYASGGGLPGVIGGAIARRLVDSSTGKTLMAVSLNELSNLITKIPTDSAGKISRVALINALNGIGQ